MRVRAAIEGNLEAYLKGEQDELARTITGAVRTRADDLKKDLRGQVRRNFRRTPRAGRKLGQNLEKATRSRHYPGRRASMGAASLVYIPWSKIGAHIDGARINAPAGRWLALPTKEADKLGLSRADEDRGTMGRHSAGSLARTARVGSGLGRFGKRLRFIPIDRSTGLLGLDLGAATGAGLKVRGKTVRGRSGRRVKRRFVPLFVLVKRVRLQPRLDVDGPAARALDRLWRDLAEELGG